MTGLKIHGVLFIFAFSLVLFSKSPAYLNPSCPVEKRVEDLLSRMSLKEKIALLSGKGFEVPENPRLGIPALKMSDGPAGVRWGKSTAFPAPIALAATWNPDLVKKVGRAMAEELMAKGRNVLLAPCVNIYRLPVGGRNFESYGEDPFLAGEIASGFIKGVQSQGVIACVKHYTANNQEWNRTKVDVIVGERALREIYLPAFRKAVNEGGALCVMAAYNKVNGDYCSENKHLLREILKNQWGFRGFVVSDWGATHSTVKAALSGLDLEMPYGRFFGEKLLEKVKKGEVSEEEINEKAKRILRAMFVSGIFDTGNRRPLEPQALDQVFTTHREIALEAARQSLVLLKNNGLLPINPQKIRSLAIIGPNAKYASTGGGGSSMVRPVRVVTPLQSLKAKLGKSVKIYYAPGAEIKGDILPVESKFLRCCGKSGLMGEYYPNRDLQGEPAIKRIDPEIFFNWGYDAAEPELSRGNDRNEFSIRWTGELLPPVSGKYKLKFLCDGGLRVYLDSRLILEEWKDPVKTLEVNLKTVEVNLEGGKPHKITLEYSSSWAVSEMKFGWEIPGRNLLGEAVEIAKKADVVLIFGGLSSHLETESWDRPSMAIPNQDELIQAVSRANPRTAVILINGSEVLVNKWVEGVGAILEAWYPGQEGALAIADALFGEFSPSGKLPFSWFKNPEDCPAFRTYKDPSLKAVYNEGVFVGYRHLTSKGIKPAFPFGHGLSYTSFKYWDLHLNKTEDSLEVSLRLSNTGNFPGAEVVQVYVAPPEGKVPRPAMELKGFQRVFLHPGETRKIAIKINLKNLRYFDENQGKWKLQKGKYRILVGGSSEDIRLKDNLEI